MAGSMPPASVRVLPADPADDSKLTPELAALKAEAERRIAEWLETGDESDHLIADLVTPCVIEAFEVINVAHQQTHTERQWRQIRRGSCAGSLR
jgi:hypothetical protein